MAAALAASIIRMKAASASQEKMVRHAAFLRGINVGGHKVIPMPALAKSFAALGLRNVRTLLASGNVVFDAEKESAAALEKRIEDGLRADFGFEISVLLRAAREINAIAAAQPFASVPGGADVKLYLLLLKEPKKHSALSGWESPLKDLKILKASDREIFTVCFPQKNGRYGHEGMELLGRQIRTQTTTRNWNTLLKIHAAMQ